MKLSYKELEQKLRETEAKLAVLQKSTDKSSFNPNQYEEAFRKMIEINPGFISISEIQTGRYVEVNKAFEDFIGFSREELIGKTSLELGIVTADERINLLARLTTENLTNISGYLINKKKERKEVTVSYHFIDFDGISCIMVSGIDKTSIIQEKIEVQKEFEELFAVFNGFEGAAHVVDINTYEILAANEYTEKLYGKNLVGDLCYKRYHKSLEGPCKSCRNPLLLDKDGNPNPPSLFEFKNPVTGRWFQCFDRAIRWPDNRLVKMEIALDIHDWKMTSDALKASEEKYRKLISKLPDAVVVHRDNKMLFISDQMFTIFGKEQSDLRDVSLLELIHPDDMDMMMSYSSKRFRGEHVPEKYEVRIKVEGSDYHIFEVRGAVIDFEGEMATMTVLTNITERKKTEEALKQTREQYFNLVENAVDAIFHGDPSGNFIGVNPRACEMTGYSKQELLSSNMGILFTDEEKMKKPLRYDLLQQGFTVRTERILTRKDGSTLPIEMNTKMMPDRTYQSFFRDFSERKKMEDELIKAKEKAEVSDRLKSAFLANMSHEIRTPLNGILGFTEILNDDSISGTKRKEFLEIISSNGKQLLAIINDIIDISKIEAGQVKITNTKCFLNQFMYEIYNFFSSEVLKKCETKVEIKLNIPSERSMLVYTDDIRVRQILHNLIGNAVKFTKKGTIEFGYSINPEKYLITFHVRDTGIGLPEEKLNMIFERFRQADDTTTRNYGGTGLGLAISKGLVELMGGKIWVESVENAGSAFYFTIPLNPVLIDDSNPEPEKHKQKNSYNWSGKTILVVEDDNDSFLYLETLLEKNNVTILRAENGKEAVERCAADKKISLILMDIQTPVMNGYEATKKIRTFNKNIPIIAQTANAFAEDREKCMASGCNDYVVKPIDVKYLFSLIDSYFETRNI